MGALTQGSLIVAPIALSLTSLLAPCLPPALVGSLFLDCKSWDDNGGAGILLRFGSAIVEGHAWFVACGIIGFVIFLAMFYPVEVIVLHIRKLER